MLHAKFVRSPHAHARILSIDTSKAEAMPGVKAVVTGADFPPPPVGIAESGETPADFSDLARNVMAQDKALYHGHAIAAVAATTLRQAEEAAKAVAVEYDVLPPVLDVRDAMRDDAPVLHESMRTKGLTDPPDRPTNIASYSIYELGDIDAGFAEADVVIEREHTVETVHQGYIEPHAAVVRTSEDGQVTIWASSQGHFMIRELSAQLLHMDISQIKVLPAEIGGGFGGKTTVYLEPVGILLSRKSDRAGEAGHDPRRGVPRLRPGAGLLHPLQARRQEGRHVDRRLCLHGLRGWRFPGLGRGRGHDGHLRAVRPGQPQDRRLGRLREQAALDRLPGAGAHPTPPSPRRPSWRRSPRSSASSRWTSGCATRPSRESPTPPACNGRASASLRRWRRLRHTSTTAPRSDPTRAAASPPAGG